MPVVVFGSIKKQSRFVWIDQSVRLPWQECQVIKQPDELHSLEEGVLQIY